MAEDWNAVAEDVVGGIIEAGTTGIIHNKGPKSGPAHNPTYNAPVEAPCNFVYGEWKTSQIDGDNIKRGDLQLLVSAGSSLTIEPTAADEFEHEGKKYQIINVDVVRPAGIPVLYIVQARG